LEMGVSQTVCSGRPQTMILPISVSQVVGIMDVSHQCPAESSPFIAKSLVVRLPESSQSSLTKSSLETLVKVHVASKFSNCLFSLLTTTTATNHPTLSLLTQRFHPSKQVKTN
jgi:hypothetical protein